MAKNILSLLVILFFVSCGAEKIDDPVSHSLLAPSVTERFEIENDCGAYAVINVFDGDQLTITISEERGKDLSNMKITIACIYHVVDVIAPGKVSIEGNKLEVEFKDNFSAGDIIVLLDNVYPPAMTSMSFKASRCEEFLEITGPDLCIHDQGAGSY